MGDVEVLFQLQEMLKVGDGRAEALILIKQTDWCFLHLERPVFLEMMCYSPSASLAIDCFTCIFFSL